MSLFRKWIQIKPIPEEWLVSCEVEGCSKLALHENNIDFEVCKRHRNLYWEYRDRALLKWLKKLWAGGRPPAATPTTQYDFVKNPPDIQSWK